MKISYNWLREYLPTELAPEKIAEILTATGLEVESVERAEKVKGGLQGVVVGKVAECWPHPDADRLKLTKVDIGSGELLQIVCGAPNVANGQKVLVATIGTTLFPITGEPLHIKKGKIRGQESFGMICAEDELGLGNNHDGIIILSDLAIPGTSAAAELGLSNDYCFEIGLTPNRTDAFSHVGVARDLYAALRNTYKNLQEEVALVPPSIRNFIPGSSKSPISVTVDDPIACPRYCGIVFENIVVKPSPQWLCDKLITIGLKPINNIVDITNFVQHEVGQPLHAFDAAKISGQKIEVRLAKPGESLITLDGVERKLNTGDLMICDAEKPMCIAGIYGGIDSGVSDSTTSIFLESAFFNPVNVRKTARRHGLHTDSSFRFERGCDPEQTLWALQRAASLILETSGGTTGSEIDVYKTKFDRPLVRYRWKQTTALIGIEIPQDSVVRILEDLDFNIENKDVDALTVRVPLARNEVVREADVVEEVLRIYGYDNVPFPDRLKSSLSYSSKPDPEKIQQSVSDFLAANGFTEMMGLSLTKHKYLETALDPDGAATAVSLLNPLSNDLSVMRKNLLFGGLEAIALNQNHRNKDLRLFEFGKTYHKRNGKYIEEMHLSVFMCGRKYPENWNNPGGDVSFTDIKGILDQVILVTGLKNVHLTSTQPTWFSDGIEMVLGKKPLASAGIVSPSILKYFDIDHPVLFADVQWENLVSSMPAQGVLYTSPDKYPAVRRDLSLLLDKNVSFSEIESAALSADKSILRSVGLFDVYEGKNLASGKKSYALSFMLQDKNKTLKDEQVEQVMNKIITVLANKFGAELRT